MQGQSSEQQRDEALRRLLAIAEQQLGHAEAGDLKALEQLSDAWEQASAEIGQPSPEAEATLRRALLLGERTQERLLEQRERLQRDLLRLRELSRAAAGYSAVTASGGGYDRRA